MSRGDIIALILTGVFVTIGVSIAYNTWTNGDSQRDYETICLEGITYWKSDFGTKAMMAVKIGPNGGVIKCDP